MMRIHVAFRSTPRHWTTYEFASAQTTLAEVDLRVRESKGMGSRDDFCIEYAVYNSHTNECAPTPITTGMDNTFILPNTYLMMRRRPMTGTPAPLVVKARMVNVPSALAMS
jgi:hypothetical protein